MENYIKTALDKVLTYETPPAIVKYMEMQIALGIRCIKKEGKELKNSLSLFYPLDGVQVA